MKNNDVQILLQIIPYVIVVVVSNKRIKLYTRLFGEFL